MTPASLHSRRVGCAAFAAVLFVAATVLVLWPYRIQSVAAAVTENPTNCTLRVHHVGGWKGARLAPFVKAENLAFPVTPLIFPACGGAAPFSAQLLSAGPGAQPIQALDCGDGRRGGGVCRLEAPPIAATGARERYIVRIVPRRGAPPADLRLELTTPYAWRSVLIDTLLSV